MNYKECVEYITNIPRNGGKNDLAYVRYLLDKVYVDGSARIIHVAGTNGKGSVCAFIDSILRNAGFRTGLFTSPHLVSINERIRICGVEISDEDFLSCFNDIMTIVNEEGMEHHPSFFEFIFLIAMRYFSLKKVDIIVLETGLGGRLDMTNSVGTKDVTVITKIGYDHMEYLGDTLESIASEKAGILKSGVPLVYWDNEDTASEVIKNSAENKNIIRYPINNQMLRLNAVSKEGIDFSFVNEYYRFDNLELGLVGKYQMQNAALAIEAVKSLKDDRINDLVIRRGLEGAKWAGRMQELEPSVYVDGAHNIDGIEAFLEAVKALSCEGARKLLFSVVADKQYMDMAAAIMNSHVFTEIYICPIDSKRALDKEHLVKAFDDWTDGDVHFYVSLSDAYRAAKDSLGVNDVLYVAGSLYLIGQLMADIS